MRSYEIALSVAGLSNGVSQLSRMGQELRRVASAQQAINQQTSLVPRVSEAAVKKLERIASAYTQIAQAAGGAQAAATAFNNVSGRGGGGAGVGGGPSRQPASQWIQGPNQRLEKILQQRIEAFLQGPTQNANVIKDLDRAERLARRSILLDERRKNDPDVQQGPGLLELFRQMNQLLRGMATRNPGMIASAIQQAQKSGGGGGTAGGMLGGAMAGGGMLKTAMIAGAAVAAVWVVVTVFKKIISAVISTFQTFIQAVSQAAKSLAEFRAAQTISGGSAGDISTLRSLGLPVSQIAGIAASVVQAMSPGGDPAAIAAAVRLGMGVNLGRPFGPTNEAGRLVEVINRLAAVQDRGERLRLARMLDLESILPMLDVSPGIQKARKGDAGVSGAVGKMFGQSGQNAMASVQRVMDNFQTALMAMGGAALPPIINGLNALADALRQLAIYFVQNPQSARRLGMMVEAALKFAAALVIVFGPVFDVITIAMKNFAVGVYEIIRLLVEAVKIAIPMGFGRLIPSLPSSDKLMEMLGLGKDSDLNTALSTNASATKDLTVAIKEGLYGGGSRARGALPGSLRGMVLGNALEGGTLRMGAFSL